MNWRKERAKCEMAGIDFNDVDYELEEEITDDDEMQETFDEMTRETGREFARKWS